ncbi:UNVERIFIED_ORG: hypothetical protein M2328_006705 [Rhodococcus erythropolis]
MRAGSCGASGQPRRHGACKVMKASRTGRTLSVNWTRSARAVVGARQCGDRVESYGISVGQRVLEIGSIGCVSCPGSRFRAEHEVGVPHPQSSLVTIGVSDFADRIEGHNG